MAANAHPNRPKNQGGFGNCGNVMRNARQHLKAKLAAVLAAKKAYGALSSCPYWILSTANEQCGVFGQK